MNLLQSIEHAFGGLKKPTMNELRAGLEALSLTKDKIAPHVTEPERLAYGRHVLLRTADVEVVVIHLPGHGKTAIHDHGSSIGCARVIEGEMLNVWYELDRGGYPEPFMAAPVASGECMYAPRGQIHEMRNEHKERIVSLHVYSPPLTGTKAYLPYREVLDFVI
ncbi:cysteine dioxygenase family protein [Paenibacillus sp. UNC499MF]|uniref:cysteine dioxygenase n=1 Tax=Paenibacillus sp. UNC499MF TaxID=1502751 RepID=UPI00089FE6AA|nr:cysteine dioxygenase family protein [Paenibacillus sp. UNC499MF]SEG42562.1 cysteine dioxygenase [Paenibacillus sp. UNC499MF]